MKVFHFQMECKSVERLPDGKGVKIRGFASTPDVDRSRDIVLPNAFAKSLAEYQKNGTAPALLRSHNPDRVVGSILMDGEDAPVISDKGFAITALVTETETAAQCEAGEMRTFSIGYICTQKQYDLRGTGRYEPSTGQELYMEVRILQEVDWVETSIVSTPDNKQAIFSVEKSATKMFDSLTSPTMEHKCSVYPQEKAVYKIGERWLSQKAVDEMQFKGEKPMTAADIEAKTFESKEDAEKFATEKELKGFKVEEKDKKFTIKFDGGDDDDAEKKSVVCVVIEGDDEAAAKAYLAEQKMSDKNLAKKDKGFAAPQLAQDEFDVSTVEVKEVKTGVKHIVATKIEKKEAKKKDEPKPQAQAGAAATGAETAPAKPEGDKPTEKGGEAGDEGKHAASVEQKAAMKILIDSMVEAKAIDLTDAEKKQVDDIAGVNALNAALFIVGKLCTLVVKQNAEMKLVKDALALIPIHKGKTIQALQNGQTVSADNETTVGEKQAKTEQQKKDAAFIGFLKSAKRGEEITIGNDE